MQHPEQSVTPASQRLSRHLRVGIDAVSVRDIEDSMASFGDRFLRRLFTEHEIAMANGPAQRPAARSAAKEAAIKAFDLPEVGVAWRDIEVRSDESGRPCLKMSGRALAATDGMAPADISVSLTHEGGIALAVVVALPV